MFPLVTCLDRTINECSHFWEIKEAWWRRLAPLWQVTWPPLLWQQDKANIFPRKAFSWKDLSNCWLQVAAPQSFFHRGAIFPPEQAGLFVPVWRKRLPLTTSYFMASHPSPRDGAIFATDQYLYGKALPHKHGGFSWEKEGHFLLENQWIPSRCHQSQQQLVKSQRPGIGTTRGSWPGLPEMRPNCSRWRFHLPFSNEQLIAEFHINLDIKSPWIFQVRFLSHPNPSTIAWWQGGTPLPLYHQWSVNTGWINKCGIDYIAKGNKVLKFTRTRNLSIPVWIIP